MARQHVLSVKHQGRVAMARQIFVSVMELFFVLESNLASSSSSSTTTRQLFCCETNASLDSVLELDDEIATSLDIFGK